MPEDATLLLRLARAALLIFATEKPSEYKLGESRQSHAIGTHSMKVRHLEARENLVEEGTFEVELEGRVGILGQISRCWD